MLVYDLGGGTFDVAILRRDGNTFSFIGQARGVENLGGIDLDQALFELLVDGAGVDDDALQNPANAAAVAQLRTSAVTAKIALSSDTEASAPVLVPAATTPIRIAGPSRTVGADETSPLSAGRAHAVVDGPSKEPRLRDAC